MASRKPHQLTSPQSSSPDNDSKQSSASTSAATKLSQQYGGQHTGSWVDRLPESWIPYIQLARLSPPVGVCLVAFPHIFGYFHGMLLLRSRANATPCISPTTPSCPSKPDPLLALVAGSFFFSNAIHGWNDLVDAPYDVLMPRTRGRPVARGAISETNAFVFTASQAMLSAVLLTLMLPDLVQAVGIAWPGVVAGFYYPFAKRHTHLAQYVLGFHLAWGVVIGTAVVFEAASGHRGTEVWSGSARVSTLCLAAVEVLWTVIYDTVYAFQDKRDDVRVGLKSTAVLFDEWTKPALAVNLLLLVGFLALLGCLNGWGWLYHGFAVGGCLLSLGTMLVKVDLEDSSSCWWWFKYGFWLAGGSITASFILEYLS